MAIQKGQAKELTSSGVISTVGKTALVWAITLLSGTTASSIVINNNGASGTAMWKLTWAATTAAGDAAVSIAFAVPIICSIDAYGVLGGTGAAAYILYDEIEA